MGYTIYYNTFYTKLIHQLPLDIAGYAIKAALLIASTTASVTAFLTDPAAVVKVPGVTPVVIEAATNRDSAGLCIRTQVRLVDLDLVWNSLRRGGMLPPKHCEIHDKPYCSQDLSLS